MKTVTLIPSTALVASGNEIDLKVVAASVGQFYSEKQLLALAAIEADSLSEAGALVVGARKQFFAVFKRHELAGFFGPLLKAHGFATATDDVIWGVVAALFQLRAFTNAYLALVGTTPLNKTVH